MYYLKHSPQIPVVWLAADWPPQEKKLIIEKPVKMKMKTTRNGSSQQKLLQRIAEDTETKIHPDGPKLRPVRLEAGWAAIPEPQVVQAVPKAIFTSSLLQVRSFSYNNEFRTELKYLSTYVF